MWLILSLFSPRSRCVSTICQWYWCFSQRATGHRMKERNEREEIFAGSSHAHLLIAPSHWVKGWIQRPEWFFSGCLAMISFSLRWKKYPGTPIKTTICQCKNTLLQIPMICAVCSVIICKVTTAKINVEQTMCKYPTLKLHWWTFLGGWCTNFYISPLFINANEVAIWMPVYLKSNWMNYHDICRAFKIQYGFDRNSPPDINR